MQAVLFYIFASLTIAGSLGVVLSANIVRMAVQLLLALLGVAGIYMLLAAEFLAAVQLVIYVGGTLVLIIFGVMLTARASSKALSASTGERVMGVLSAGLLLAALVAAIVSTRFPHSPATPHPYPVRALGQSLLGDYLLPFELASLLLLAVMIGAAYLAKKRPAEKEGA